MYSAFDMFKLLRWGRDHLLHSYRDFEGHYILRKKMFSVTQ